MGAAAKSARSHLTIAHTGTGHPEAPGTASGVYHPAETCGAARWISTTPDCKRGARRIEAKYPGGLALRVHRALSWLARAERSDGDDDARFIFLWISLNAAYGDEIQRETAPEQAILDRFFSRLVALDSANLLYELVWAKFPGPVRLLLDNRYVFQPFWGPPERQDRRGALETQLRGREGQGPARPRRPQPHGHRSGHRPGAPVHATQPAHPTAGATWHSSINRDQVRDGTAILADLVPRVIHLMMANPEEDWGDPSYPVV